MPRPRSTSPGQHRPVLLEEILKLVNPKPGQILVDCTIGFAGHAVELLKRVGPTGLLIGLDLDSDNLPMARERLQAVGFPFELHHANFAGLDAILNASPKALGGADLIVADLGMSSMQVDDPERGFSYARDGVLDMRMDQSRGRSAAQILESLTEEELRKALAELGDEPAAGTLAKAIVRSRQIEPIVRTRRLADIIQDAVGKSQWQLHPKPGQWHSHPAARTFQALRLLVNRELGNLSNLLRILPTCLRPGGTAAVISFHSGEDRLAKGAFRDGWRGKIYDALSQDPVRPRFVERQLNPRSCSAKLRWARRASE